MSKKRIEFRESFVYSTSNRLPLLISLIGILLIAVGFWVLSLPVVKWVSLFPFGFGLLFLLWCIIARRAMVREIRRVKDLKERGVKLVVEVLEWKTGASNVVEGETRPLFLKARFIQNDTIYEVKTQFLRRDFRPFLKDNQLIIYHEANNMSNYFVDIAESVVEKQEKVIIL